MNSFRTSNIFGNTPPVVRNLIIINVALLLGTMITERAGNYFMTENLALFYPGSPLFKPWQLVTHMFMHGSFWHLLFNMYALWMFGCSLEYQWGTKKFSIFYFVTGIGAALFYCLVLWLQVLHAEAQIDPDTLMRMRELLGQGQILTSYSVPVDTWNSIMHTPMVGASGAVYGILLGFGMLFPNVRLQFIFPPVNLSAKWAVIIFGGIELMLGIANTGDNVAHFAHLGGMLFAFILIKLWKKKNRMYDYGR